MESEELVTQRRLAASLTLPPEFAPVLGGAFVLHLVTSAIGIQQQSLGGLALIAAGLIVFGLASAWLLTRFRAVNGASVGGLTSRAVLGTSHLSSVVYAAAFAATTWAALEGAWWLAVLSALAGGAAYVGAALVWWRRYQQEPATHARGESRLVLGLLGLTALAAAVLLVAYR